MLRQQHIKQKMFEIISLGANVIIGDAVWKITFIFITYGQFFIAPFPDTITLRASPRCIRPDRPERELPLSKIAPHTEISRV